MKRLVLSAVAVAAMFAARAGVFYVDHDGTGDGSSWEGATTFEAAISAAASAGEATELRVKKGQYLIAAKVAATVNQPLVIRGGYTGEDETTRDGVTSFDANGAALAGILDLTMNADLEIDSCEFVNCRPNTYCSAVYLKKGTSACNLTLNNCSFSGNQSTANNNYGCVKGLRIENFTTATITGCSFCRNGFTQGVTSANNHMDKNIGAAGTGLMVTGTKTTMTNCRVAGNKFECHCDYANALWFSGASCNGSVVKNCAIVGNLGIRSDANEGKGYQNECAVYVGLGGSNAITFENCTIAYNSIIENSSSPGLRVESGAVTIRNSVFYANIGAGTASESSKKPADVYAEPGTTVTMSYCWTRGTGTAYVSGNVAQDLALTGDEPGFVSTLADYNAAQNLNVTKLPYSTQTSPNFKTSAEDAAALDVHLLSKAGRWNGTDWVTDETSSGLLDMGDPASDYSNEPDFNGGAINLGAYGNTAEASKSLKATPVFTEMVDVTGDYTMPHDTVVCGGDGIYHCDVYFCWGAEGTTDSLASWENKVLCKSDAKPGDTIDVRPMRYFEQGTELRWAVLFVEKDGTAVEAASEIRTTVLAQPTPPWYGKGGGARVLHVRPGATGTGDGTTWTDALHTYDEMLAALVADPSAYDEVWISGDLSSKVGQKESLTLPGALAIRGGFTGAEDTPAERPADGTTATIDGNTFAYYLLYFSNAEPLTLDRLTLKRAYKQAFVKTGAGDLTILGTVFRDNISDQSLRGHGAQLTGSTTATLTMLECAFEANQYTGGSGQGSVSGCGLDVSTFGRVVLERTKFVGNGLPRSTTHNVAFNLSAGVAASFVNAPVQAKFVEVRNNIGGVHQGNPGSCAFYLGGNSGGSSFANCIWAGNVMLGDDSWMGGIGGFPNAGAAMVVNLSSKADAVSFDKCTVAYNLMTDYANAGGMNVRGGTATIRNSIFWANVTTFQRGTQNQVTPADIFVATDSGFVDIDWCCIGDPNSAAYLTQSATRVSKGGNFVAFDPLFATSTQDFVAMILPQSAAAFPAMNGGVDWVRFSSAVDDGLDLHLRSQAGRYLDGAWVNDALNSPCINTGDPAADYSQEPTPNGDRVNLGAYGNTAEASKSDPFDPQLGEVTMRTDVDYTMPHVSVTCAGSGVYSMNVYFCYGDEASAEDGTNGWQHVVHAGIGHCTDVIDASPREYLPANATVAWRIVMIDANTGIRHGETDIASVTVGATLPPWYLKGGAANVIHVRAGATGKATGLNWTDAYTTWAEAVQNLSADRNEIWVVGDFTWPQTTTSAMTPTYPIAFRGGFAGCENTPDERAKGARSVIDSREMYRTFWFNTAQKVVLDSFDVNGSTTSILTKEGAGDFDLLNCRLRGSVTSSAHNAVSLSGGNAGVLRIADCEIVGNHISASAAKDVGAVKGLSISSFVRATVDNTLFASNGYARAKTEAFNHQGYAQDSVKGTAVRVVDTPTAFTGCRFLNNTYVCHVGNSSVVWIEGNSGGSAMTNCLVAGNSGLFSDAQGGKGNSTEGAVLVKLNSASATFDVVNCTFAYNIIYERVAPCGLNIQNGKGNILNSIFYDNVQLGSNLAAPADVLAVTASTIDYSWVATNTTKCLSGAATLTQGEHLTMGAEPYFVTPNADFRALIKDWKYFKPALDATPFNFHLRGKYGYTDELTGEKTVVPMPAEQLALKVKQSPCIDAGDPATGCRKEAKPNGGVVNLGYYGNTPWASRSAGQGFAVILR